jgi:hypothetical protein
MSNVRAGLQKLKDNGWNPRQVKYRGFTKVLKKSFPERTWGGIRDEYNIYDGKLVPREKPSLGCEKVRLNGLFLIGSWNANNPIHLSLQQDIKLDSIEETPVAHNKLLTPTLKNEASTGKISLREKLDSFKDYTSNFKLLMTEEDAIYVAELERKKLLKEQADKVSLKQKVDSFKCHSNFYLCTPKEADLDPNGPAKKGDAFSSVPVEVSFIFLSI